MRKTRARSVTFTASEAEISLLWGKRPIFRMIYRKARPMPNLREIRVHPCLTLCSPDDRCRTMLFFAHGDRQPTSRPERGSAPFAGWDACLCSGYDAFQPSLSVSYINLGRSEACRTVTGERRNALLSVEQMCGLLSVHRRLRYLRCCSSRFGGDLFENSATEKMIKTAKNRDFKEK